jgi:integrase
VRRLRSFFTFCAQRGWLRGDPLAEVDFLREQHKVRLQPPAHELLDMLDLVESPRDRAFLAVLTNTGLRAGSVRSLRVGDVDLAKQHLRVVIHKSKQEDEFPIATELDRELRKWLRAYAADIGRPLRSTDYLFPSLRSVLAGPGWPPPVVRTIKLLPDKPLVQRADRPGSALPVGLPDQGRGQGRCLGRRCSSRVRSR